jgi:hypothetical protein
VSPSNHAAASMRLVTQQQASAVVVLCSVSLLY